MIIKLWITQLCRELVSRCPFLDPLGQAQTRADEVCQQARPGQHKLGGHHLVWPPRFRCSMESNSWMYILIILAGDQIIKCIRCHQALDRRSSGCGSACVAVTAWGLFPCQDSQPCFGPSICGQSGPSSSSWERWMRLRWNAQNNPWSIKKMEGNCCNRTFWATSMTLVFTWGGSKSARALRSRNRFKTGGIACKRPFWSPHQFQPKTQKKQNWTHWPLRISRPGAIFQPLAAFQPKATLTSMAPAWAWSWTATAMQVLRHHPHNGNFNNLHSLWQVVTLLDLKDLQMAQLMYTKPQMLVKVTTNHELSSHLMSSSPLGVYPKVCVYVCVFSPLKIGKGTKFPLSQRPLPAMRSSFLANYLDS